VLKRPAEVEFPADQKVTYLVMAIPLPALELGLRPNELNSLSYIIEGKGLTAGS
jgi:hypothetical protein